MVSPALLALATTARTRAAFTPNLSLTNSVRRLALNLVQILSTSTMYPGSAIVFLLKKAPPLPTI